MEYISRFNSFIMVGIPGSGKTTLAHKLANLIKSNTSRRFDVISSDDVREELYGDANTQGIWEDIWEEMEIKMAESADMGHGVIIDSTHSDKRGRDRTECTLMKYSLGPSEFIYMTTSLKDSLKNNTLRSRHVPNHIIYAMHNKLHHVASGLKPR
jgi:predicted kinase